MRLWPASPCAGARRDASALLDGRLEAGARATLQRHLHECAACTHELQQLARVSRAMHNLPPFRVADGMASRLRRQFAAAPTAPPRPERSSARRRIGLGLAAAAVVGLVFGLGYRCGQGQGTPASVPLPATPAVAEVPAPAKVAAPPALELPEQAPVPNARFANFGDPPSPRR